MKTLVVSVLFMLSSLWGYAQFTVDAGSNAKTCHYDDTVRLGGHPSASGGKAPYYYSWKSRFYHTTGWYPIWNVLKDPASPNPIINRDFLLINDTIEFYLTVTDADQNILKDSVIVIVSSFMILTMENGVTINLGDSAQIIRQWVGGISPLTYIWTPAAGLSDPYVERPWAKPYVSTSYYGLVTDAIGCSINDYCWVEVRTTGIDPNENSKASSVYPEPVNFRSVIHISYPDFTGLTIKVFGQNGYLLLSDRFYQDYRIGEKIETPGTYYYMIFKGNNPVTGGGIIKL